MTLQERKAIKTGDVLVIGEGGYYDIQSGTMVLVTRVSEEHGSLFLKVINSNDKDKVGKPIGFWGMNNEDRIRNIKVL